VPLYQAQTTIVTTSGIAADNAINTTYWVAADTSNLDDVASALDASYTVMRPYFASFVPQNGHSTKFYDLEDPIPRAPVAEFSWGLDTSPTGSALPTEVALCVSFQGDPLSGQPQARRRGRNYLPFLGGSVIDGVGRPSTAVINAAVAWGQGLLDFSQTGGNPTWVVNSTFGAPLEFTTTITNGWVDNEFDTQRRRGRAATARTTFA
jgi:hypothetical protein